MELHQLRYLTAVARTGNFSRAAEQCHVSQPSLSQQIQKLEEELGCRLFTRLKREAVPTEAGKALLLRATRILAEVDAAQRDADNAAVGQVRGTVNVGVLPTIAPHLLPAVMKRMRAELPAVQVIVHETTTTNLLAQAGACELDFAILSLPITDERFVIETLFSEELLLAVPKDHELATRGEVRLEDVEQEPFILLQEGHCLGDQALRFCDRHRCHPPVIFRTAQLETIQALVAAGVGVSLIPNMACKSGRATEPTYLSLAGKRPERAIAVIWRKEQHLSRAAAALLEVLRKTCHGSDVGKTPASPRPSVKAKAKADKVKKR
ncbi:LysR family hydrogen peroxide-inducible transcriptional activator [Roseimicrobium gellanilyticum]|uniref:LysR family hydrogen peroxide-inducible transcriptional activator n=1 Tax=Roseimicrobium gellanilyticum TaxID=748857 RepID=A0A366HBP3_9BACT|nr:LysR substrate-binding domain-containing protein [Roseimicrobium gellanilyticum]RBP39064.1 LysR family hydrogen peroxide-inducible transcriptional activator [Roseimicrobium gellanilyticum]